MRGGGGGGGADDDDGDAWADAMLRYDRMEEAEAASDAYDRQKRAARAAAPPPRKAPSILKAEDGDGRTFGFYGTLILDATRKEKRAVPLFKEEVRDEKGRKRLHGAFTGGFSAGYFNTVGSKEGFTPGTFVSSRSARASSSQTRRPEDFMDEEDMRDFGGALQASSSFANDAQPIPGFAVDERQDPMLARLAQEFVLPRRNNIGVQIMQRMGWRPGQGIGPRRARPLVPGVELTDDDELSANGKLQLLAPLDVPLVSTTPKPDTHGLGFDAADGFMADDSDALFAAARVRKQQQQQKSSHKSIGLSVFEEDDEIDVYDTDAFDAPRSTFGSLKTSAAAPQVTFKKPQSVKTKAASSFAVCADGRPPLPGFSLSKVPLTSGTLYFPPPPAPPGLTLQDLRHIHVPDEAAAAASAATAAASTSTAPSHVPSHNERAAMLGEERSVLDMLKPADRERLLAIKGGLGAKFAPAAPAAPAVPPLDPAAARSALQGFMPFSDNPAKQARYAAYLTASAAGTFSPSAAGDEAELGEFYKSANIFRPLSSLMASRFTPASTGTAAAKVDETPKPMTREAAEAAARPVRTELLWAPSRLLCKRMNIEPPSSSVPHAAAQKAAGIYSATASAGQVAAALAAAPKAASTAAATEEEALASAQLPSGAVDGGTNDVFFLGNEKPSIDIFKAIFEADDTVLPPPEESADEQKNDFFDSAGAFDFGSIDADKGEPSAHGGQQEFQMLPEEADFVAKLIKTATEALPMTTSAASSAAAARPPADSDDSSSDDDSSSGESDGEDEKPAAKPAETVNLDGLLFVEKPEKHKDKKTRRSAEEKERRREKKRKRKEKKERKEKKRAKKAAKEGDKRKESRH